MYMFQFVHLSEGKRIHQTFQRRGLTNFYATSYSWFAASLLANCQYAQNYLELVKTWCK